MRKPSSAKKTRVYLKKITGREPHSMGDNFKTETDA